jgi:putative ABC transport system ATP-binding protein
MLRIAELTFLDWRPVSLDLESGSCAGIVGASGSGKSLLLRAIADLDPHEGEVEWRDKRCSEMPAVNWRKRVGLLPAESAWWFESVGAHFSDAKEALRLTERLGFGADVLDWEVRRLSVGERQRLALVRLLLNRPEVLLLDEPTANLDEFATGAVEDLIREYRWEHGAVVIWVSHSGEQLERVADVLFKMENRELGEVAKG